MNENSENDEQLKDGYPDPDSEEFDETPGDLSDDQLSVALGSPLQRLAVPALITAAVLATAAGIWFLGGDALRRFSQTGRDTLAVAEAMPDTATAQPAGEAAVPDTSLSLIETQVGEEEAGRMPVNDYYRLLNAQVSEEEAKILADTAFYQMLFTPLIPAPELPAPERGRLPGLAPPGITVRGVDTTRFVREIDSLGARLEDYRNLVAKLRRDSVAMQHRLNLVAQAADSARQSEIRRLAKIMDSMDPASAAVMLSARTSAEVTELLFRIKPRVAAKILQHLPAAKRSRIAADLVRK